MKQTFFEVGDIITGASVLIALCGFLYTWIKDRKLQVRERADKIRMSAALTLARFDRSETLLLSFFDRIQPIITSADTLFVRSRDRIETRDFFWKELHAARVELLDKLRDEQIEIAYSPLVGYHRDLRDAAYALRESGLRVFQETQTACQDIIMTVDPASAVSATLGNRLRTTCGPIRSGFRYQLDSQLQPTRALLLDIMSWSDDTILSDHARRLAQQPTASPSSAPHSAPSSPLQG